MATVRLALANLPAATTPAASVTNATDAIDEAARRGADIVCFPECYVPGYRTAARALPPPDADFLAQAWQTVAATAGAADIAVVLGTERVVSDGLRISTLVVNADGTIAGFHDKVQLHPSEEITYGSAGDERHVYRAGALTFGLAICHEGWRYPETVRWAARRGAQVVFVPHFHEAEPGGFQPTTFADPANTFHEKALLCRAAENTCYIASVNYATDGSPTTSAVVNPAGTLLAWQPYGKAGLLVADIDLDAATGLLASRLRT
jgi:predicted amidohydrolase